MTAGDKLINFYSKVNKAWDAAFDGWEWLEDKKNHGTFILGEKSLKYGYAFHLAGCEDCYGSWIWLEYEPEKDLVGLYIKDRPVLPKFKGDLQNLFEKYAPFDMELSFEKDGAPVLSRKEQVRPEELLRYFEEFKLAYSENYPLFYMLTVSAQKWYDGFNIWGSDC